MMPLCVSDVIIDPGRPPAFDATAAVSDPPKRDESGKKTSNRVAVVFGTKAAANPVTSPRLRKFSIMIELCWNVFPGPRFVATVIALARAVQQARTTSANAWPMVDIP